MIWLTTAVLLVLAVGSSHGFFGGPSPAWDSLRATFSLNPFAKYHFNNLPRTIEEATSGDEKWEAIGDSDCKTQNWRGRRYVARVNGELDYSTILLYDVNGYIAGIQASVPKGGDFPPPSLRPPFVEDGARWTISAYFVHPDTICSGGRSEDDFRKQGTGTGLYIQESEDPIAATLIPMELEDAKKDSDWTEGQCFKIMMGVHFWHKAGKDMDCGKSLPVFLMYNFGRLNSWGWAFMNNMTSPRWEHPTTDKLQLFFKEVPECIKAAPARSTMHIYFDNPLNNYCYSITEKAKEKINAATKWLRDLF